MSIEEKLMAAKRHFYDEIQVNTTVLEKRIYGAISKSKSSSRYRISNIFSITAGTAIAGLCVAGVMVYTNTRNVHTTIPTHSTQTIITVGGTSNVKQPLTKSEKDVQNKVGFKYIEPTVLPAGYGSLHLKIEPSGTSKLVQLAYENSDASKGLEIIETSAPNGKFPLDPKSQSNNVSTETIAGVPVDVISYQPIGFHYWFINHDVFFQVVSEHNPTQSINALLADLIHKGNVR